jgi:hypothetical protein
VTNVQSIIEKAGLGIVEQAWLAVAMEVFIPTDQRPVISIDNVRFVMWPAMEAALEKWHEVESDPNHLDVIYKLRAAEKSREGGTS